MTVDISKIRVGDEVLVRAVITDATPDRDGDLRGKVGAGGDLDGRMFFNARNVVSHTPREIRVGDKVKVDNKTYEREVLFVEGCVAFLKPLECGLTPHTAPLSELTRLSA